MQSWSSRDWFWSVERQKIPASHTVMRQLGYKAKGFISCVGVVRFGEQVVMSILLFGFEYGAVSEYLKTQVEENIILILSSRNDESCARTYSSLSSVLTWVEQSHDWSRVARHRSLILIQELKSSSQARTICGPLQAVFSSSCPDSVVKYER